jgi:5'-methylthioadenosine phosphorylase
MAKIGIIGGTLFFNSTLFSRARRMSIKSRYGKVEAHLQGNIVFIQRHGPRKLPPHSINHKANISAFRKLGITKVIGVNSVGSLKTSIKPGSIVVPDDYIHLSSVPTFFGNKSVHITPTMNNELRNTIIEAGKALNIRLVTKATYINTIGPRYETKAEIRMFRNFADIVGMTMAYEATLAQEAGIEYASICSVDNYAHGIAGERPRYRKMVELSKKNAEKVVSIIKEALRMLKCQY